VNGTDSPFVLLLKSLSCGAQRASRRVAYAQSALTLSRNRAKTPEQNHTQAGQLAARRSVLAARRRIKSRNDEKRSMNRWGILSPNSTLFAAAAVELGDDILAQQKPSRRLSK